MTIAFRSTRGEAPELSFSRAALRGLAPDGGLYVPTRFPDAEAIQAGSLAEVAERLLAPFFAGDELEPELGAICRDALDFPVPLRSLDAHTRLLELFHGPTAAFKDVGARFLAACFARLDRPLTILVATSGDTGGAIASAFHGRDGIEVGILFPEEGVSARQRAQLTCWDGNVHAFAVRGVFDDCQRMVKAAFADEAWRAAKNLTSANSINIGRLLPQAAYYAHAALAHGRRPSFVIPSGNVGNACAALWARAMGLPIERIVMTANANRPVPDFLADGDWQPRPSVATLANAMDVGNPSNMERVRDLYPEIAALREVVEASSTDDATIRRRIVEARERWGVVLCPHTATAADWRLDRPDGEAVLVATAHPAKFESVVEPLIGESLPVPPQLAELLGRPDRSTTIDAELAALQRALG